MLDPGDCAAEVFNSRASPENLLYKSEIA